MTERRLQIRFRAPRHVVQTQDMTIEHHDRFIVVKSDSARDATRVADNLSGDPPAAPAGTPVVWLPRGSEFEVWEIDE